MNALPLRDSDEIQGNILAGFNKDHQVFLFLHFSDQRNGAARARSWLAALIPRIATTRQVATFNAQFSQARRNRGGDDPELLAAKWVNLALTHAGIVALDPRRRAGLQRFEAFRTGARARADLLRDRGLSDPGHWVIGAAGQPEIHAILTVAADETDDLRAEIDSLWALAAKHGISVVFEQRGETLPGPRAGHEHFGFKDGISQPGVIGFHEPDPDDPEERKDHPGTDMIQPGEFILGLPRHGEHGKLDEPYPHPAWMANGSFQIFRRLSQDVPGWWAQVIARAQSLPDDEPISPDQLAAKLVGRWRSGTPLAHEPVRDNRSAQNPALDNDFNYDDDRDGFKTPRFAHIRKMYPRDERFGDERRRMIRRGIPFGRAFDPAAGRGHGVDADRGLCFNAFVGSIEEQFESLQIAFANAADSPGNVFGDGRVDGPDPVIGEDSAPVELRREGKPDQHLDFQRFVHTTGAVYAFAPSISALKMLAGG